MADKLVYKGGHTVVDHTGTEMQLTLPKRGGSVHRFPRWWNKKGTIAYIEVAIFDVALDNGTAVRLVVPQTGPAMTLEIRHDGAGEFTFPKVNKGAIERVGVFAVDSNDLLVEYQFSKISGGSVLKRSIKSLPIPPAPVSFSTTTSQSGTPEDGETLTFTAGTFSGGIGSVSTNLIIQTSDTGTSGWTFLSGNPNTASGASVTYVIPAGQVGKYLRGSFQVTDDNGVTSSNSTATAEIT